MSLRMGENVALPPDVWAVGDLDAVVEWSGDPMVVDLSAILVNGGRVRSDEDFVFYNQPVSVDGSVRHLGSTSAALGASRQSIRLTLSTVAPDVTGVFIAASTDTVDMAAVGGLRLTLVDTSGQAVVRYDVPAGVERAVVVSEIYRRADGWKVRAVGQGWSSGLAGLAAHFGISVADESDSSPPPVVAPPAAAAEPPPASPPLPATSPTNPHPATSSPVSGAAVEVPARPWPGMLFRPPPGWPTPPAGWTPTPGWTPEQAWPAPPSGWVYWTDPPPAVPPYPGGPGRVDPPVGAAQPLRQRWFGGARRSDLQAENQQLRAQLAQLGALDQAQREQQMQQARDELRALIDQVMQARREVEEARHQLVVTDEELILQEAGIYRYHHPLQYAEQYKDRLAKLKDQMKLLTRNRQAVLAATSWTVNGSARQGMTMVRDFSKLMLRAYNAEADNCVRTVRPHTVDSAAQRLDKTRDTIARLGATMFIRIGDAYHALRVDEIRLTGDYLAKREEEKEQARAERERQREEDAARRELERETQRLRREHDHYATALARLHAAGDSAAVAEMEAKLREIDEAIRGVQDRAANIRAGYVYVISNIGAFGPNMIKIGMTRRLEPMDRVRELGDASVPFRFDVHALIFSHDAVGLENRLHTEFTTQRVNRVNTHREFFYATPAEVRQTLARIAGQHLIEYRDQPEALEWRASGQHPTPTPGPRQSA
ncbi:hypothetical protein GCM10010532_081560 [Dactylosporangium siamense]